MNVLVIGASRGIGMELVRQYLRAGDRVLATARNDAGLARLTALGAQAFPLDVAQADSVSGLSRLLNAEKLDLALYVAGVFAIDNAKCAPTQLAFDTIMHTNVLGAMQLLPMVAPGVEAAAGQFVFLSSDMGRISAAPSSYGWLYRASKAALNMAVVAAQGDYPLAQMVLMHPGWVQTDMGTAAATLPVQASVANMRRSLAELKRPARVLSAQDVPYVQWDGTLLPSW